MNSILEGGPWTMDHRPFILRKWSPQVRMEQERLSSIPIWIRLPNLPLHLWEEDCLSLIGSLLGVPLFVDSATLQCSHASYARICVEAQASSPLPDSILVEVAPGIRESFKVDYDWKPQACKYCQTICHDKVGCVMKPTVEVPNTDKGRKTLTKATTSKRIEKGSGKIHKSKHKGGGPPQPPKKNKIASKGAPSGKRSTKSYME
ncbi:hypothetical protein QJS10_CPA16g00398 [Acorus calamus]|uniref:DUF4283 domain-containing protein n=1 Tax=Acorus calamus TaxID=4465 RepID=A0AAV9D4B2_ACOCL|nr:hypothetical protein QJS10_CPA16g00398 [Acorus calamus]